MKMRTSLIAAAVASVCAAPAMAQDMELPEVYGRLNVGLMNTNDDVAIDASGNEDAEGELALGSATSHFGFRGDHELGNGMSALYQYEVGVDATDMEIDESGRLSWVGLEGDFGTVKAGQLYSGFYNDIGVIADLGWAIAAAPAYYSLGGGLALLRPSDTVQYNYGQGGPFEVTVEGQFSAEDHVDEDTDEAQEKEDVDRVSISGAADVGPVRLSLGHTSMSVAGDAAEPSATGLGVVGDVGAVTIGGSYVAADMDADGNDSPSALDVVASTDFGGGLGGFLGVSQFDNDQDDDEGDMTSVWGQVSQSLGEGTSVFAEFQADSIDGGDGGEDVDPTTVYVGMNLQF